MHLLQAGYSSGYDNNSYASYGAPAQQQQQPAYQAPTQPPPAHFAPQRTSMQPGTGSYSAQAGGYGAPAAQASYNQVSPTVVL